MITNNAELPERTAGECTLADGTGVWVQTLNTLHRSEADKHARRTAQNECQSLLKGGSDHGLLVAQVKALSADDQATYIAGAGVWQTQKDAFAKFPSAPELEQGDLEPDAFSREFAAWESRETEQAKKRAEYEKEKFEDAEKAALKLTTRQRQQKCETIFFGREFFDVFVIRLKLETLLRAVRQADNHSLRHYDCIQEVEDETDDNQAALWNLYGELDVRSDAIPT